MTPIFIFDLDGTLADCTHRLPFITGERKDWRAFFAACVDDKPIEAGIRTFRALQQGGAEVWIWTGRSDEVREQTIKWLRDHDLYPRLWMWPFLSVERFRMRQSGDYRHDDVLKREWLSELDPPEFNRLTAVFEDRSRVVQMWRQVGVPCFQVAEGEF